MALVLALAVAGCTTLPQARVSLAGLPSSQVAQAEKNLSVFNAVWDLVNRKHYDPKYQGVDWEAAAAEFGPRAARAVDNRELYRVLNEMVGQLRDSHTHVLTPDQADERRTRLRARTGFNMARVEGRWVVTEVLEKSPAAEAGIREGWIVLARNGVPLGQEIDFRPSAGEAARWEFLDEQDRRIELAPEAKSLSIAPRQAARELGEGFVYLRFDEFDRVDRRWLSRQLKQHRNARGVVVDLRRNGGGDTFSLSTIVGEFFDRPVDLGTFITRSGARTIPSSWQLGSAKYRGPLVVLVDGATASAAEIFAAVLQAHDRATIVGRRTAGAVLASWFYRLPDGGQLQLSRMDYIAPDERRIEAEGVVPDVVVPRTLADLRARRDPDMEQAIEILRRAANERSVTEASDRVRAAPAGA